MDGKEIEADGWCLTPDAAERAQSNRRDWIENGVNYGSPDPRSISWATQEAALSMGWSSEDLMPCVIDF